MNFFLNALGYFVSVYTPEYTSQLVTKETGISSLDCFMLTQDITKDKTFFKGRKIV